MYARNYYWVICCIERKIILFLKHLHVCEIFNKYKKNIKDENICEWKGCKYSLAHNIYFKVSKKQKIVGFADYQK